MRIPPKAGFLFLRLDIFLFICKINNHLDWHFYNIHNRQKGIDHVLEKRKEGEKKYYSLSN